MHSYSRGLFFLLLVSVLSCNKVTDNFVSEPQITYNIYYPTAKGFWIDYQVDSIRYVKSNLDPVPIITKTVTYFRELIEDTITGFDTPYQFKIKVFTRKSLSDPWIFLRNNSIQPLSDRLSKNESNLRFIKLHSPVNSNISWKGNKHIDTSIKQDHGDWNYRYIDLYQPKTLSGFQFDSTITVLQYLDSNVIEKTHFFEIYAKAVGMIYSERHKLEKQNVENFWDKPENGYSIITRIIDWKR
jgi:hypothetical protein